MLVSILARVFMISLRTGHTSRLFYSHFGMLLHVPEHFRIDDVQNNVNPNQAFIKRNILWNATSAAQYGQMLLALCILLFRSYVKHRITLEWRFEHLLSIALHSSAVCGNTGVGIEPLHREHARHI